MAVFTSTPNCMHLAAISLNVKCSPLSVKAFICMIKLLAHWMSMIVAIAAAFLFVFGITLAKFENRLS